MNKHWIWLFSLHLYHCLNCFLQLFHLINKWYTLELWFDSIKDALELLGCIIGLGISIDSLCVICISVVVNWICLILSVSKNPFEHHKSRTQFVIRFPYYCIIEFNHRNMFNHLYYWDFGRPYLQYNMCQFIINECNSIT